MIALIKNEWMKAWHGRKVWLFLNLMAAFILLGVGFALLAQASMDQEMTNGNQSVSIETDNESANAMTSAEFSGVGTGVLTTFVNLYAVILITTAIAGEYTSGTIKQLLIRPASRSKALFAKWFGNMLHSVFLIALVVAATYAVGLMIFPTEQPIGETLSIHGESILYMLPTLIFYMSLATMLAVLTKSTAITIIVTFIPYFFSSILQVLLAQFDWAKWIVFAHVDVYSNYHPEGMMEPPFADLWASLGYLGLHIAAFLIVAHIVFKKRDVL